MVVTAISSLNTQESIERENSMFRTLEWAVEESSPALFYLWSKYRFKC